MTTQTVLWQPWTEPGLEHLRITGHDFGITAESVFVRVLKGHPFRAAYRMTCDPGWRFRRIELTVGDQTNRGLTLETDGDGHWADANGVAIPDLLGCFEVDLSATPFTNTLVIGRLGLLPGQSAELSVAYIRLPDLTVRPVRQRYTCLERTAEGGTFKYEGLFRNFTGVLRVDKDLLVIDYPETFRRVRPH